MSPTRALKTLTHPRALACMLGLLGLFTVVAVLCGPRLGWSGTLFAPEARASETASAPTDAAASLHAPQPGDAKTTDSEALGGDLMVFQKDPTETMVQSLKERERKLDERERKLAEEERRLQDLKREVEAKLTASEQVLKDMRQLAGQADVEREKEIGKWIKIYQAMPAADAGKVIAELDPEFARLLLARMEAKKAAKILATFPPDKAVELGRKLEQEKQTASKN